MIPRERRLAAAGLFAAALCAVFLNVLANRHYRRWDATRNKLYTLSEPTLFTLAALDREADPVELFVFIGGGDPLLGTVKQMLTGYQAKAPRQLVVRYLDPDRDRAELLRLQAELDVHVGKAEGGRILSDAQIVARHGKRVWYVKTDDMIVLDEGDDAKVKPRVEGALTGAIRAVLSTDRPRVCFTTGHREASIDDPGKDGLSTLKNTLAKDNYAPESVELPKNGAQLKGCMLVAIVAPREPFTAVDSQAVVDAVVGGASLLLSAPPEIDLEKKGLVAHGLGPIAALGGVQLDDAVSVETEPALREPSSLGLVFRAKVGAHATTDDLRKFVESRGGGEAYVPVMYVRPLRRTNEGGVASSALLFSSDKSFALFDIAAFLTSKQEPQKGAGDRQGPLDLAAAAERPRLAGGARGPRVVVVGSSTPFLNLAYADPTPAMTFSRTLGLLWVSWLGARAPILDLPPKASVQVAMHLTEADISSIGRYVLVFMPAATLLLGGAVWMRRRTTEGKRKR